MRKSAFVCMIITVAVWAAEDPTAKQQAYQQLQLIQKKHLNALQAKNTSNKGVPAAPAPADPPANAVSTGAETPSKAVAASPETKPPVPPTLLPQKTDEQLVEEKAFETLLQQKFPLSPEQILRLRQIFDTNAFAEASTPGTPPKPTATSQMVNLSPGSVPPVIRLAQGFVSSLVFLDSTGAPWPIIAYDLGDPAAFNIQWDKLSNTLMIQALKLYNYGNLAVRLKGLNTPVMLTLIPGQKAVDYRVDLRIQGYGPHAKAMPVGESLPPSANDILLHVLDGVPPPGSQRLVISGGDARGWLLNEKMYVRTGLTIISPGWIETMTSADGTHAYELQKSPVLLVSWHGKVMQLKVEGL